MNLITRNASPLLLEKVKSLAGNPVSWRAIYINFAGFKEQYSEGLRTYVVTNIIKELLDEKDGYIYLLDDGDVFLLFKGQVTPVLQKLGGYFKDLGTEKSVSELEDTLYTVFDLSKHWQIFLTLCKTKAGPETPKPVQAPEPEKPAIRTVPDIDIGVFQKSCLQRIGRVKPLVLIVEDDPFTRKLVVMTLKGDFDILEAEDGMSAVQNYQMHAPDAVFLDIELPDTNGHVILKKLIAADKAAFVVMLSANSMKENVLAALETGAQGFVTKPFAKEKLMHYLGLCRMGQARPQMA